MSGAQVHAGARARTRRRVLVSIALGVLVGTLFCAELLLGDTFYTPSEILRVMAGETVPGAAFTVGELRIPRGILAVVAGIAFGAAGVTFQTMLRNPLASPDIIGISTGASASAVVAILLLGLGSTGTAIFAVTGALVTALAIYLLSNKGGFAGTRLILIGLGLSSMLSSVVAYLLSNAATWDLQGALRWMTGSLNAATPQNIIPVVFAVIVLFPLLLLNDRSLNLLRLGDDAATALGVKPGRARVVAIVAAVALLAIATSVAGPIAFVAFMAGPIAARLVGPGASLLIPSSLVGAALVLGADLIGQYALPHRYPVGIVTGVLGAPFLIYLLVRTNKAGGSL